MTLDYHYPITDFYLVFVMMILSQNKIYNLVKFVLVIV